MPVAKKELRRLYTQNLIATKQKIRDAVSIDNIIINAVSNVDELNKAANLLSKRLREWYALYNPEAEKSITDNEAFSRLITEKSKNQLLQECGVLPKDSMGADFHKKDLDEIYMLAKVVQSNYDLIYTHKRYLEKILKEQCPNFLEIAGVQVAAQLILHAKSIKNLALMTASKIQLLGAEKALFRHLKTGAKVPKHGLIVQHTLVSRAKARDKGKIARALADKLSMAIKVDYFKGEPVAKRFIADLEKRFGKF